MKAIESCLLIILVSLAISFGCNTDQADRHDGKGETSADQVENAIEELLTELKTQIGEYSYAPLPEIEVVEKIVASAESARLKIAYKFQVDLTRELGQSTLIQADGNVVPEDSLAKFLTKDKIGSLFVKEHYIERTIEGSEDYHGPLPFTEFIGVSDMMDIKLVAYDSDGLLTVVSDEYTINATRKQSESTDGYNWEVELASK